MAQAQVSLSVVSKDHLNLVLDLKKNNRWADILALANDFAFDATGLSGEFFDTVCFALGQQERWDEAIDMADKLVSAEASSMRLSAAAYARYAPLTAGESVTGRSRDQLLKEFYEQIQAHIDNSRLPITSLYRRGKVLAKIENRRDKQALQDFQAAIELWEALDPDAQKKFHFFKKSYLKSLYSAAGSALALGKLDWAKAYIARSLRLDQGRKQAVAPVFKLYLAAKIIEAMGDLQRAERGYRQAADAPGPKNRSFVHGRIVRLMQGRAEHSQALAWLERHVPARWRPAYLWRLNAELLISLERSDEAVQALKTAVRKDRETRHLSLVDLGNLQLQRGELGQAKQSFNEALTLRRKRHQVTDLNALRGLKKVAEELGDSEELRRLMEEVKRVEGSRVQWSSGNLQR